MQLDRPFGAPEFRPRKDAQAQIDHAGVKGVELVTEAKAMLRHLIQALLIELDEQGLVDAIRAAFIGVGERTAPDLGGPNGVVEELALGLERQDEVAQAGLPTGLRVEQRAELRPAGERSHTLLAAMSTGQLLELGARNEA